MSTAIASTGFSQEAFDAFLAARDEPAWLDRHAPQGLAAVSRIADAVGRDEEWMRTDIRLFKLDRFELARSGGARRGRASCLPHALLAAGVELGRPGRERSNSHSVSAELDAEAGPSRACCSAA